MLGIAARVQEIKTRAITLARLQLELVTLELKRKGKALAIAAVLAIIALVVVLYAIGFIFAAIAAGVAEALPLWAALLIVSLLLLLTAAVLLYLAVRSARKAGPARPVEAVAEAQKTVQEIRDA
jgi:H+/Cl- antiporter ClcA